ncbi:MAG TPA: hypothetical protein ENK18_07915 [Deltaproteobacteria bacterium]|nr:hypothetical protein [Deltaproteobacteria bacterium]
MIELGLLCGEQLLRLERYERLRGRLPLPRLGIVRHPGGARVWIEPPPPLAPPALGIAAWIVGWLAGLERAWGSSLAWDLWPGEAGWDPARAVVVVGPGLLQPSGDRGELDRLSALLGIAGVLDSYVQLAHSAAAQHPGLAPLLTAQEGAPPPLRALRALGQQRLAEHAPGEALQSLGAAHTLRETDVAVAVELVRAAITAERPDAIPATAIDCLQRAPGRADAGLALARWHQALDRPGDALQAASLAAEAEPDRRAPWAAVAELAAATGDPDRALWAIEHLAGLGSEGALEQLWRSRGPPACFSLMDRWPAASTPRFRRLRLAQLHAQERTRELLQLVADNLDDLDGDEVVESWIVEATRRTPGAGLALRQALHPACLGPYPGEGLVRLFLRSCLSDGVFAPIVELGRRHPGRVPPALWVRALLEEGHHVEVLAQTERGWADDPELAWPRLASTLSLALRGRSVSPEDLRACARVVARDQDAVACARARLRRLVTPGPALPILSEVLHALGLQ